MTECTYFRHASRDHKYEAIASCRSFEPASYSSRRDDVQTGFLSLGLAIIGAVALAAVRRLV